MKRAPWILASLLLAGTAHAQTDQSQLVRPQGAADLNSHLARLASNPRDVSALIGAGEAALALDDPRAAAGFFARADAIESGNGRIKAGLGRVMLKLDNPAEALRLFDQAGRLGYPDTTILSDRALARDVTGDQAGAQSDYQAALKLTPDDADLRRRYAASLGISGQVEAADNVLQPLLYKSDRAAWRYRAFIYAMNNKQADAKKIADQTLPAPLAAAIVPYMQKMPYLTAAQKAAALHFGRFPQQIGTSIAAITPTPPAPGFTPTPTVAASGPKLAEAEPAKSNARDRVSSRRRDRRPTTRETRMAQAETKPPVAAKLTPTPTPAPAPAPAPAPSATQPQRSAVSPVQPAAPQPQTQPRALAQALAQNPTQSQVQGPPSPGFDSIDQKPTPTPSPAPAPSPAPSSPPPATALARAETPPAATPPTASTSAQASPPPMVQPVVPVAPSPNPEATRSLADIIRAIDVPDTERQASVAAVDLNEVAKMQEARRLERQAAADKAKKAATAKAKAEADAKARKEAEEKKRLADNPSRNWLQVGVGQSKSALGFTMKGLRKKYSSLAPQDAWSASWSRTNRLLVGPFSSFTRAKELETKLKAAGADVFAWKSDAGEVVEKLPGG